MALGGTTSTCLGTALFKSQTKKTDKPHNATKYGHNTFNLETHKTSLPRVSIFLTMKVI